MAVPSVDAEEDMEEEEFKDYGNTDDMFQGNQVKWQGKFLGYYIKGERGLVLIVPRKRGTRTKQQHFFWLYEGYGMNTLLLEDLLQKRVIEIRVKEQDTGKILISTPERWLQKGIPHRSKGYEPQTILRERDFDKIIE